MWLWLPPVSPVLALYNPPPSATGVAVSNMQSAAETVAAPSIEIRHNTH